MINFLIQSYQNEQDTSNRIPLHDFSFALIESIKYNNWFCGQKFYDYKLKVGDIFEKDELNNYIPSGSVEFVQNFIKQKKSGINIRPINIPDSLFKREFLGRFVIKNDYTWLSNYPQSMYCFVKDASKIKGVADLIPIKQIENFISDNNLTDYFVSEYIEILSEWRVFVFNKRILDIRNYSGAFDIFPDMRMVKDIIDHYDDSPPAYTADFAITKNGTYLIECHNFFSCGLYGFSDYQYLPSMLIKSFQWQLKQ